MDLNQTAQVIKSKFPEAIAEEQKGAIVVKREAFLDVAKFLKSDELDFSNLHCVTAVDRKDKIEMVYLFYSFKHHFMLNLKVFLNNDDLNIETLALMWKSADWLEREVFDLFGVKFLNHPDMRRILNPDEWTDYPLRKNFAREDFIPLPPVDGLKK